MIAIGKFRPEIAPDATGCPGPMIDRAVRHAAIEFCRFTLSWREELDPVKVRNGVAEYEFDQPSCALVETVRFAAHNGYQIYRITEAELDADSDSWRANTASQAIGYYMPDRTKIRLVDVPDTTASKGLKLVVALKPTQDADELPDILYNDHLKAIGHGAKEQLFVMPGKPWSNPALASYHKEEFDRLKAEEQALRLTDYTRKPFRTKKPFNSCW